MLYWAFHPILIAAAVIPAIVLMSYVYKADRLEKEPGSLLSLLLVQGVISTALAVFAERLGTRILSLIFAENTWTYQILFNFIVVGLSEEGFKYLLLRRRTWASPAFNCQFDGVVYAVFVSLGFALWENIDYVVMYGFGTALLRAVTAVPGHACFGVFMGAWYGAAKRFDNRGRIAERDRCLRLAVICPVLLHGAYDLIATIEGGAITFAFVIFIAAVFAAAFFTVRRLSRQDRFIR